MTSTFDLTDPAAPVAPPPGWYPDPLRRWPSRYWDGTYWTAAVAGADGRQYRHPIRSGPRPDQVPYVDAIRGYLQDAAQRGLITARHVSPLVDDVNAWERSPVLAAPDAALRYPDVMAAPVQPVAPPEVAPQPAAVPSTAPPVVAPQPVTPPHATPSPLAPQPAAPQPVAAAPAPVPAPVPSPVVVGPEPEEPHEGWWHRMVSAVSADLTVHGLADLGVVLLFAGLFGLIAFAFGEVRVGLRPVAEFAIPATLLGAGAFMQRRGTKVIGDALVFLGGALLPIVLIASMSDGAAFPPDLTGTALAVALTALLAAVAGLEVLAAWRWPRTPLRYLVGPTAWLAVAAAGLGIGRAVPSGSNLVTPTAAQWALVAVAVAATVALARGVLPERWRTPVLVSAWPGLAVSYALTLLAAGRDGWPAPAVVAAGLAVVIALELLAPASAAVVTLLQLAVVALSTTVAAVAWGIGTPVAVAGAVVLAGAEYRAWRRSPKWTVDLLLWAAGAALVTSVATVTTSPWATVAVATVAWCWAVLRSERPATVVSPRLATVLVWLAVVPWALALTLATSTTTAQVVTAAVVLAVTVVRRLRSDDRLWDRWIPAMAMVALAWVLVPPVPTSWPVISAAVLVALAAALAPRWPVLRVWSAAAATATAGGLVLVRLDPAVVVVTAALAGLGLVVIAVGEVRRTGIGGHLTVIGDLLTASAVSLAFFDMGSIEAEVITAALAGALVACFAGWAASAVAEEVRGSTLSDLLVRAVHGGHAPSDGAVSTWDGRLRNVPLVLAVPLAPTALVAVLDACLPGSVDTRSEWWLLAPVALMVGLAGVARLMATSRPAAARIVAREGFVVAALWALFTLSSAAVGAVGMSLVIAHEVLVGPRLRRGFMTWVSLLASGALTGCVADLTGVPGEWWSTVVLGWGSVVLVGGLAWDARGVVDAHRGDRWARSSLLAPVVLGSSAVVIGLGGAWARGGAVSSWSSLAAAVVVAVVALQVGVPLLSGLGWILASASYAGFVSVSPIEEPWVWLPWIAALMVVAEGLSHLPAEAAPWHRRWAVPPAATALLVAAVALTESASVGWVPATWCGIGGLAIVFGLRVRQLGWSIGGVALVVVGAGVAGPGWLALALAVVAVLAAVGVTRTSGSVRDLCRVVAASAASGAWIATCAWRDWGVLPASTITAVAAGALVVLSAVALRVHVLDRAGTVTVDVPAAAALVVSAGWWLAAAEPRSPSGYAVAGGVGLAAVGLGASATPARWPWLRPTAAVTLLSALWLLIPTTDPTADQVAVLAASAGLLAAVVALVLVLVERLRSWLVPVVILAGGAFATAVVASAAGSPAWRAFAFAAVATAAVVAATRLRGAPRWSMQATAALAASVAWLSVGAWLQPGGTAWAAANGILGGVVVLASGSLTRVPRVHRDWLVTAASPAAVSLGGATVALYVSAIDRAVAGPWVAGAWAAAAVGVGVSARPLRQAWLRTAAVVLAAGAAALLWDVLEVGLTAGAAVAAVVALALTAAVVVLTRTGWVRDWMVPLEVGAVLGALGAWAGATTGDLRPVELALLLTGAQLVAFGVARHRPALVDLAPAVFCVAWIAYAAEVLSGRPVWFTVPVGLTVLVTVGLARDQRRRAGHAPGEPLLDLLEIVGMALMVIVPLVQIVTDSLAWTVLALVLGAALGGWGVLTHVRRRLAAGVITVAASVGLLLLVPMADVARRVTGPWVWLSVAAVGLVAIVVAAVLERTRAAMRRSVEKLRDATADWE